MTRFITSLGVALCIQLAACKPNHSKAPVAQKPVDGSRKITSGAQQNGGTSAVPENLNMRMNCDPSNDVSPQPYLFSCQNAMAIQQIVEPLRFTEIAPFEKSSRYSSLRINLEAAINRALAEPSFAPRRMMKLSILDDPSINAIAKGADSINLHTGIIENLNIFTGTLCHELAHATLNHIAKDESWDAEWEIYKNIVLEYVQRSYDANTMIYTHDPAVFSTYQNRIRIELSNYENFNKKLESEADIVGAMICAKMGLRMDEYTHQMTNLVTALQQEAIREKQNSERNGTNFSLDTYWQVEIELKPLLAGIRSILSLDTHPEWEERIPQLIRVAPAINKWYDATSQHAANIEQVVTANRNFSLTGSKHEHRPVLGCNHDRAPPQSIFDEIEATFQQQKKSLLNMFPLREDLQRHQQSKVIGN